MLLAYTTFNSTVLCVFFVITCVRALFVILYELQNKLMIVISRASSRIKTDFDDLH